MPTALTAQGPLPRQAGDPSLPPDLRLPSGLWLVQKRELPGDAWLTEEPDPEVLKAGRWDRAHGDGDGFAAGGVTDNLPPGPVLAGFADDAWTAGLGRLSDDELIGVLRASRRLASWAAAMELDCVADLWRRRTIEEDAGDAGAAGHAGDEIAAALTLTSRAADGVLDLAIALRRLPAASAALATGAIDLPRAKVIADEVTGLTDEHAAGVDQVIASAAPGQTTGQLRAATRRAVIASDPAAARKRKEQALREARVERWDESAGTAALAGRDLPPVSVLAADQNLTALAMQLKNAGVAGTLDTLRAQAYLALLTGAPITSLLPSANGPMGGDPGDRGPSGCRLSDGEPTAGAPLSTGSVAGTPPAAGVSGSVDVTRGSVDPIGSGVGSVAGGVDSIDGGVGPIGGLVGPFGSIVDLTRGGVGPIRGNVNLTVPLATWLGGSGEPGHAAGYGPLDATDSRDLADVMAAGPGGRWCITFTGADGRPVAHGCARTGPPADLRRTQPEARPRASPGTRPRDWTWTFTVTPLGSPACEHVSETPGYRPSAALRHLVEIRQPTCSHPGCRRPAACCDVDHTVPYHLGGRTCLCNLAPLCRRHHRVKQARGWALRQVSPGVLTWSTPAGRRYTVTPA
jgi:hypothetical protein